MYVCLYVCYSQVTVQMATMTRVITALLLSTNPRFGTRVHSFHSISHHRKMPRVYGLDPVHRLAIIILSM